MVGKKDTAKKTSPPSPLTEEKPISLDPLFGVPTQRIYPRDFELGELKPLDSTVQDAVKVVEEFFARVQQGSSLIELLHPDNRWFLEEDLKQWQGKSISFREIRFGRVSESPLGVIEIPFRVLQEERSFTGSILLEKQETKWYVADFFLDWTEFALKGSSSQSAQKATKGKENFDPFKE